MECFYINDIPGVSLIIMDILPKWSSSQKFLIVITPAQFLALVSCSLSLETGYSKQKLLHIIDVGLLLKSTQSVCFHRILLALSFNAALVYY